jgi:hypothetical protein
MRKKRAWSTREDDAESKETAAFEATVAAAKDTAAKSGAFLSSANEDLTDHHRWLRAQSAAVERDRQRHERWLQRQRDQRLALAKKERVRRRRQLMRQRVMLATRHAIVAGLLFVRSCIAFAFAKIGAGFKFVGTTIGRGLAYIGRQIATGAQWMGAKLGLAASEAGKGLSTGSSLIASKVGIGLSAAGAKGSVLAGAMGRSASSGFSHLAAKASALGAASKRGLASGYRWSVTRAAAASPAVYTQLAKFGRRAEHFARTRSADAERLSPPEVQTPPAASVHVIEVYGPHKESVELFGRRANDPWTPEGSKTLSAGEVYGPFYEGFWVEGASPNEPHEAASVLGSRAEGESALSSWGTGSAGRAGALATQARIAAGQAGAWTRTQAGRAGAWAGAQPWAKTESWGRAKARAEAWTRTRDVDLSQMMIIAGAVLLVCGGLLVGGGLLMRAGARTPTVADLAPEETFSGITWTFNEPDLPLPERAVFTLSGTPESFRINGLSVSGVNNSDQPLTGLQGVLKPAVQRPDLKLSLQVDKKQTPSGEGAAPQTTVVAPGKVPAHTPFRLVFPFPAEAMGGEDGITVDEFFDSYGGLLLKLRYEIEGVEKSVIQYLGPDLLKGQLDEVSAPVAGG